MHSLVVFLVNTPDDCTDNLVGFIDSIRYDPVVEDYDLQVDVSEGEEFTLNYTGETVYLCRHPD